MPHLIFDTETTGLPKSWDAPMKDIGNWPSIVQLAWQLVDEEFNTLEAGNRIIRCKERITPEAVKIHGITQARSLAEGLPVLDVLAEFTTTAGKADTVVAHNLKFDYTVLGSEYLRWRKNHPLGHLQKICIMKASTDFCALPGRYGNKWPTLEELHRKLFDEGIPGAHDAGVDVEATRRCFAALSKANVI